MMYVWLLVGFVLLIKGADFFVDGSCSVAKLLKVPSVIIGLTIVAMGTSAPEAAVSISAGLSGSNEIALSNVIGSNIFNLLIVIGACAAIKAFEVDLDILKRDLPINIGTALLLLAFLLDRHLSRLEGIILFGGIVAYLIMLVRHAQNNRTEEEEYETNSVLVSVLYIVLGLAAVIIGGDMVVDNACLIADKLGMSETLIGLTIVSIGTSLPELVTSIVAATKGKPELALGNAVGSCIFNILFILGMSASLSPIAGTMENLIDIIVLLFVTVIIYGFGKTKRRIERWEGIAGILFYAAYLAYIILR